MGHVFMAIHVAARHSFCQILPDPEQKERRTQILVLFICAISVMIADEFLWLYAFSSGEKGFQSSG